MVVSRGAAMKLVQWVRFNWDLDTLPAPGVLLPEHYHFATIGPTEEKELRALITRSFAHDSSWGDAIHEVNALVAGWLERAFDPEKSGLCLALQHGTRMIGATILVPDPVAEDHLAPGPCVQMEYRNRGLGTALLWESLRQLREAGLTRAVAVAKSNGPVARYLYPKFNGTLVPGTSPLLAA
jgi:predicted N-acetyltransferase YhbS